MVVQENRGRKIKYNTMEEPLVGLPNGEDFNGSRYGAQGYSLGYGVVSGSGLKRVWYPDDYSEEAIEATFEDHIDEGDLILVTSNIRGKNSKGENIIVGVPVVARVLDVMEYPEEDDDPSTPYQLDVTIIGSPLFMMGGNSLYNATITGITVYCGETPFFYCKTKAPIVNVRGKRTNARVLAYREAIVADPAIAFMVEFTTQGIKTRDRFYKRCKTPPTPGK